MRDYETGVPRRTAGETFTNVLFLGINCLLILCYQMMKVELVLGEQVVQWRLFRFLSGILAK